ncbi:MAG: hypothetical protein NVS4B9_40370 [Ktedonobacteraceae bacterium]
MAIMAMHIQHGERPIFFYGQHYMGTLEAYVAALLFQFLGVSVFALRLGLILFFMLFLLCMYLLTRWLYTPNFALFTLLLLSLGSSAVFARQLIALGGYAETIFFTVLLFLLTGWLTRSAARGALRARLVEYAGYACWGLVLGLALWCDPIILPWALCAGALLLLFCWPALVRGAVFALLVGLLVGALPLIIYNLRAAPGQDSWSVLIGQQGGTPLTLLTLLRQLTGTLGVSIPNITGSPFCHTDELADIKILGFAPSQPLTLTCYVFGGAWSLLYLALLALAAAMAFRELYKALRRCHFRPWTLAVRDDIVRAALVCSLFTAALGTLLLYTRSHSPIDAPAEYARYLTCLWVVTPLALWPLWHYARRCSTHFTTVLAPGRHALFASLRPWLARGLLLLLLAILCYGSAETLGELPMAQAADRQEARLVTGLLQHGITHIYTDYWTCDRLAFQSQERIICGVLAGGCTLQRGLHNRYEPYYTTVSRDPRASYVILTSTQCDAAVAQKMHSNGHIYTVFTLNEYTIYQPL